jgi:hypothetical protein
MKLLCAAFSILLILAAFQSVAAQNLCDRVAHIKILPMKGEPDLDPNYDALINAGQCTMPCLIRMVTDTRRMRDPRSAPGYPGIQVRVGDVAFFMLFRIARTEFVDLLPPRVQREWEDIGVWAYFRFVQNKSNRRWLQRKLKTWYRKNYS